MCVRLPCPEGPLPPCAPDEPVDDLVLCCPKCTPGKNTEVVISDIGHLDKGLH